MNNVSKAEEQQALQALEQAIKLANDGLAPDEALLKAAQEAKLPMAMIQRVTEAFNTTKTLKHLKSAKAGDRAASFPIAHVEVILGKMFPQEPETIAKAAAVALHPDYLRAGLEKAAEAAPVLPRMTEKTPAPYERDPAYFAKRAIDERNTLVTLHRQATEAYREMYYRMLGTIDKAAAYWRRPGERDEFDLVEKRAFDRFGLCTVPLMQAIVEVGHLDQRPIMVKRAKADELPHQRQMIFDETCAPYDSIGDAVFFAKQAARLAREAGAIERTINEHAVVNARYLPETHVTTALEKLGMVQAGPTEDAEQARLRLQAIYHALCAA